MSESGIIQPLSAVAINQIAAGEVIDRPLSIIKELIDNSIDAGATKITIDLTAGGVQKIRVHDNGCGIFYPDLFKLAHNHYTSKLTDLTDLYNNPKLGFRGEALASIAHVSSVTAASKAANASVAYAAVYDTPESPTVSPTHHETGTTITACYLFDQLPVRRRFLKSESTEYQHCHNLVMHYALLFPAIDFKLSHNGKCTLNTTHASTALAVASLLFDQTPHLKPIDTHYGSIHIHGFASTPQLHAGSRNRQYLAVNQRPIKSMIMNRALTDAYKEHIVPNRHPYCLLALTVPDEHVDVNIHPQKRDVKFLDEQAVYRAVKHSVAALFSQVHFSTPASQPPAHNAEPPHSHHAPPAVQPASPLPIDRHPHVHSEPDAIPKTSPKLSPELSPNARSKSVPEQLGFTPPKPKHPHYLQVFGTYIILQVDQSVWILDQHAVHERILYERIRASHAPDSQPYLSPKVMALEPDQMSAYTDRQATLRQLGFDTDIFGPNQIVIRGVPQLFMDVAIESILSDLLNQDLDTADTTTIHSWQQRACKSAIKAGKRLLPADVDALIEQFLETPNNYTCPHGRPLFVEYSVADFEQWFKRR
jgi:DNA mismatch repair protein MutL